MRAEGAEIEWRYKGDPEWVALLSADIIIRDPLRSSVEAATGGLCTVLYTAKGQPSYFRVVPKFLCEDVAPGGELGTGVHPAFIHDGVEVNEIFVGMYQMAEVDGEGVSQPGRAPRVSINWQNSRNLMQACGPGFDMMTVWDWAAVVLWSAAHGHDMRGNTQFGRHHNERHETGRRVGPGLPGENVGAADGNTLTGSGPNSWRHDNSPSGIADMVGNVWEWVDGFKMVDGRIHLAADNGTTALAETNWLDTGWDMPTSRTWRTIDSTGAGLDVKRSLIVPNGAHDPIGYCYTTLTGERFPYRGGGRGNGSTAGPAALNLYFARTHSDSNIGSRPRFRNP